VTGVGAGIPSFFDYRLLAGNFEQFAGVFERDLVFEFIGAGIGAARFNSDEA